MESVMPRSASARYAVRHETFTARFVDGRNRAIGDYYLESTLAGGDRRGQSCRSSADDENVSVPPMW